LQKLYVIEDDENIRMLVLYALQTEFDAEGFSCGEDFFQAMRTQLPDLVLLDIMLPDGNGLSILKELRSAPKAADLPVILLTAKGSEFDRVSGLDSGADDYIVKPFSVLELVSRIKAVLRRNSHKSKESALTMGSVSLYPNQHAVKVLDEEVSLTHKEFQLLSFLMENKDIVMTRDRLMDQIWGIDFQGESRTVDMHIKTLRQKLGIGGDIIKTIRSVGYKAGD